MANTDEQSAAAGPPSPPHEAGDPEAVPSDLPRPGAWAVTLAAVLIVVAFAGLFLLAWFPRRERMAEVDRVSNDRNSAVPVVQTTLPKRMEGSPGLWFPADVRANQETLLFPRANGYLKRLLVDIGDHVTSGQLLAEIDTPDVDADLQAARAALLLAHANEGKAQDDFDLAQATLTRYTGYAQSGGVTQQQLQERQSAFSQAKSGLAAARASVQSADAAVQRLVALQGFEKVTAPFAGTITARNYDVGALMSASNTADGKEVFRIADIATLRIFVNIPQVHATAVKTGQTASLVVRNFPGREFTGVISRSAGELDATSRTLRYQIDFDNRDGLLYAGMYAQARLTVSAANTPQVPMTVPTSALVVDSLGTRVWIVSDSQVHPKKIDVGRDFGTEIEVAGGLQGDEQVVTNPGLRLADGTRVQVAAPVKQASERPGQAAAR